MQGHAVVFTDREQVAFQAVEIPSPGTRDVVVRTRHSWISNGTETSFLRGERTDGEVPYREGAPWPFPIVMGYQSCGVVESVGAEVTDIKPGDWVFCTLGKVQGMYKPIGGHIDPKVCDRAQVFPLPEGISPVAASGLVLTQVGYNCGACPPLGIGDSTLVIGDGMVGQWAAQTLAWRGARVLLAGRNDARLALWRQGYGRRAVNVRGEDLAAAVGAFAPEGLQAVVDACGTVESLRSSMDWMRRGGALVSAGFHGEQSMLDVQTLRYRELSFHSPSGWTIPRMQQTLELIAQGHLQTEHLITHRYAAQDAAQAWDTILRRKNNVLGVVLDWTV